MCVVKPIDYAFSLEEMMQIKMNKEIRGYSESVFFGLSMRQFFFSLLAVLVAETFAWRGNGVMGLHTWSGPVCRNGVHKLSRHDSRKAVGDMAEGYGYAQTVGFQ